MMQYITDSAVWVGQDLSMGPFASLRTHEIEGFEELNEVVLGIKRQIVQIERGKIHGRLSHGSIAGLPLDHATFDLGIRSNGGSPKNRFGIGLLLEARNRVTWSSYECEPGHLMIMPPGGEHENRYYGGASLIVISVSPAEIESSLGAEGQLGDPETWGRSHFKATADTLQQVIPHLNSLITRLGEVELSAEAAEFWKRTLIEAMTANMSASMASVRDGPPPSALKMVRRIEEYLDERGAGPVHISGICSQLHVSRRTLHRVFHEALGMGPVAFLRHRRLCAVHTALRIPQDIRTVSEIAMQYGFQNLGRFAGYYRRLFGEYPSETRRRCA